MWRGLFDEQVHLLSYIDRFLFAEVTACKQKGDAKVKSQFWVHIRSSSELWALIQYKGTVLPVQGFPL